jgi:transposase
VLYLGEISDAQRASWERRIGVFDEERGETRQMLLFPANQRATETNDADSVRVVLHGFELCHARQWGACWAFCRLWDELGLDGFWGDLLPASRKGTRWLDVLKVLCANRLIAPGSEWRVHREWFRRSAMRDLLGCGQEVAARDTLYRCLDKALPHKEALFQFLRRRWADMFSASFDVLLYDLTSTYFESEPPFPEADKRKFGYSRDHRPDCVQVVVALVVTPEGFPVAYEVMPGNTADCATLRAFLDKIEGLYGVARRVWLMDRGIPTEETLKELRARGGQYVVGTPKGRLSKLEANLAERPWQKVRDKVRVKLLPEDEEVTVFIESADRVQKERSMRRRRMKKLLKRLAALAEKPLPYETLLQKIGAAKEEAGRDARFVAITMPELPVGGGPKTPVAFSYRIDRDALRVGRRREGRYLLRSNMLGRDPANLWEFYLKLVEVEAAFRTLKGDLEIRPVFHQEMPRIEGHIFIAFIAYCLHVTLRTLLAAHAPGLTPRGALEKLAAMQMLDVLFPTTDGRKLIFARYTSPDADQRLVIDALGWNLPPQAPPRITAAGKLENA